MMVGMEPCRNLAVYVRFVLIIAWFVSLNVNGAAQQADFFSGNLHDLTNLALYDIKFALELEAFSNSTAVTSLRNNVRRLIDNYLNDFREANGVQEVHHVELQEVIGNPVSVYRLVRRYHLFLPKIVKEALRRAIIARTVRPPLPGPEDLLDVADATLRIESTYNFNVTQFADGIVNERTTKSQLRGIHCAEIGARALETELLADAVEWLQEARRRTTADGTLPLDMIEEKVNSALKMHDEVWDEVARTNSLNLPIINLFLKPLRSALPPVNTKLREALYKTTKGEDIVDFEVNSLGLCREEDLRSSKVKAWLFCWLEFKTHPMYTIGPLKMEFLDRYPTIVQIYDAFSPADMEELISRAGSMRPSETDAAGEERSSLHRYSSNSWLPPKMDLKISRKIETMVGMKVAGAGRRAADPTQMACYTVGGHYRNHLDTFTDQRGDRIVTFMIYLNTVEQGGVTAFPTSLTFAKPVKGSAVFWFNLHSDGSFDSATLHTACPVVIGKKWTATKWIRMYDQFLGKPCLLKPHERFQFPVHGKYLPLPKGLRQKLTEKDELALKEVRREEGY